MAIVNAKSIVSPFATPTPATPIVTPKTGIEATPIATPKTGIEATPIATPLKDLWERPAYITPAPPPQQPPTQIPQAVGEFAVPGDAEQFFSETKSKYKEPTPIEQFAFFARPWFGEDTASNQYYQGIQDYFSQPTQTSGIFDYYGESMFTPQQGEKFTKQTYPGMTQPGVGQGFIGGQLTDRAGQTGSQNQAQQAWERFMGQIPDIARDPGLEPYYENAKRRALEGINRAAAAGGTYGSSAAQDQRAEAIMNLEAERANREAQYNLARLAEQRGWEGLGGQLAGQASGAQLGWTTGLGGLGLGAEGLDLSRTEAAIRAALAGDTTALNRLATGFDISRGIDADTLARIMGGGELAGQTDIQDLAKVMGAGSLAGEATEAILTRLMGGTRAAEGAQEAGRVRGLDLYNKLMGPLGLSVPTATNAYENLFTSDQALQDAVFAALLGEGAEGIRGQQQQIENEREDLGIVADIMSTFIGGGGMGGMAGGK